MKGVRRGRRWPFLVLLLVAGLAPAAEQPLTYARGEYTFQYPAELIVLQDYDYAEVTLPGGGHVVVLSHRDAQVGDLRSIEINMLRSLKRRQTCADYAACRVVDGVVIGTNSQDPELQRAFGVVTATFRRR